MTATDLLPGPVVQVAGPVRPLQSSLQRHQPSKLPEVRPGLAQLLEAGPQAGLLRSVYVKSSRFFIHTWKGQSMVV